MSHDSPGAPDAPETDYDRLVYCWLAGEEYDPNALSQPWEDTNIPVASNSIAAGWACRIGRAILIEEQAGTRNSELFETDAEAEAAWPAYVAEYDEPVGDMIDPPSAPEVEL